MVIMQPITTALETYSKDFMIYSKNIVTNIYRIQAYNSIMFGYFCIGFIDFMLKGTSLLEYTHLFSPNEYKENDKILKSLQ